MVDFASTQPQAKEGAHPASREGDQAEAATAKPLRASCHRRHTTSEVRLLASISPNSHLGSGRD
jgi:hypothetical protein